MNNNDNNKVDRDDDDDDDDDDNIDINEYNNNYNITINILKKLYYLPLDKAAKQLNISTSTLKKLCRIYLIEKWPYRIVHKIINQIELVKLTNINNKQTLQEKLLINKQIQLLYELLEKVINDPNKYNTNYDLSNDIDNIINTNNITNIELSTKSSNYLLSGITNNTSTTVSNNQSHNQINKINKKRKNQEFFSVHNIIPLPSPEPMNPYVYQTISAYKDDKLTNHLSNYINSNIHTSNLYNKVNNIVIDTTNLLNENYNQSGKYVIQGPVILPRLKKRLHKTNNTIDIPMDLSHLQEPNVFSNHNLEIIPTCVMLPFNI